MPSAPDKTTRPILQKHCVKLRAVACNQSSQPPYPLPTAVPGAFPCTVLVEVLWNFRRHAHEHLPGQKLGADSCCRPDVTHEVTYVGARQPGEQQPHKNPFSGMCPTSATDASTCTYARLVLLRGFRPAGRTDPHKFFRTKCGHGPVATLPAQRTGMSCTPPTCFRSACHRQVWGIFDHDLHVTWGVPSNKTFHAHNSATWKGTPIRYAQARRCPGRSG